MIIYMMPRAAKPRRVSSWRLGTLGRSNSFGEETEPQRYRFRHC